VFRRRCRAGLLFAALALAAVLPAQAQGAADLARRAEAQFDVGHGAEAIALWQQALALYTAAADSAGQLRVLERLGTTASLTGQMAEASGYLARALELARRSGNTALEADVLVKLADAASRAGDRPRAIAANRDLLGRAEAAGDTATAALAAARLGQALLDDAQLEPAALAFRRAAALFRKLGERSNESAALDYAGDALRRQEDYVGAAEAYRQAARVAREASSARLEAEALHGLGLSSSYLGDYAGATDTLKDAIRVARRGGERAIEAAALMSLGNVQYFLSQPADAARTYEQVVAAAQALHDRALEAEALGNLGLALGQTGQFDRAAEYLRQDIAIARERGDRLVESQALGNLGTQLIQQGHYGDAIGALQQSRELARAVGYRRGEAIALRNLGFAQFHHGQAAAAEASLRAAIALQEALRAQAAGIDRFNVSLFDTQLDAHRTLQAALVAQGRPEAALQASEQGRARALADLLARRGTAPAQAQAQAQATPLTIDAIRAVARTRHETLVEFSVVPADSAIYVWAVRPDGAIQFRRIGLELRGATVDGALEGLIRDTRAALGALGPRDIPAPRPGIAGRDELLAMWHRLLIAPVAELLPASPEAPVVIIAQGPLFLLPFAALRDERGRTLLESHTLAMAPSIQALAQLGTPRAAPGGRALVAGNPALSDLRVAALGDAPVRFQPLPAAEREAMLVAALLDTRPLIGPAASKSAVLSLAPDARVIHLATHGIAEDVRGQGLPGALVLAASGTDDGLLSSSEIMGLRLHAGLVVLSACNTGLGNLSGDGVIGLSRAFMAAGAQSVVVSLWSVPDQPTAELMQAFYRSLASSPNKAAALRHAMLATRARYPDPLAWAGFILVGESE